MLSVIDNQSTMGRAFALRSNSCLIETLHILLSTKLTDLTFRRVTFSYVQGLCSISNLK